MANQTPNQLPKDAWLSLREVQRFLIQAQINRSDNWVREMGDAGVLPSTRDTSGRVRQYSYNGLLRYIKKHGRGSRVPSMARGKRR